MDTFLEQEIAKFKSINEDRLNKITLLKKQYKEDKWLISQMEASSKRRKYANTEQESGEHTEAPDGLKKLKEKYADQADQEAVDQE